MIFTGPPKRPAVQNLFLLL